MSLPAWTGPRRRTRAATAHEKGTAAAVAGLLAIVTFLMREALAGGVLYRRDVHLVWHPQVEAFVRAVASGSWPVWDPGPMFGQPLMADPSAMVLYPFTWLNLALRPWTYYTVFVLFHLCASALGMRLLARRLGMSQGAAFVAAALWTACGPFLSLIDLWHHFAGAAWMPWVLLAAEATLASPRPARALVWGAATGGQILAGSADMCAMTGLIALGLLLARVDRADLTGPATRRLLASAALAFLFALALSAGLWMTALDVAAQSDRASLPEQIRAYWSVHPLALAQALSAGLWTRLPLNTHWHAALFESREPFLGSLYLGLPTLGLVGAALCGPRDRVRVVLAVAVLVSVLVALGRHAPFYDVLVAVVPGLRILRYPVKAMVPAALCWTLLAGIGFDVWARAQGVTRRRWTLAVLGPVAVVFGRGHGGRRPVRRLSGLDRGEAPLPHRRRRAPERRRGGRRPGRGRGPGRRHVRHGHGTSSLGTAGRHERRRPGRARPGRPAVRPPPRTAGGAGRAVQAPAGGGRRPGPHPARPRVCV